MRQAPWIKAEPYRVQIPLMESAWGDSFGLFVARFEAFGATLRIMVSDGRNSLLEHGPKYAWDHASVSCADRTPTWAEMCFVKELFWEDHETVIQFHVPAAEHINCHPFTLHLWAPLLLPIPRPPARMV